MAVLDSRNCRMADKLERKRLPFTIIENRILEDENISSHALLVYLSLCKYADSKDQCFPSLTSLSKAARVSRRKVVYCIKELIDQEYITKVIRLRKDCKKRQSNLYTIVRQYHYSPKPMAQDALSHNDIVHGVHQGSA
ncbi:MAG: helix-turn-helix domain-containing protein, partial [Planctomycetes bacterium]|nr:helix-turn-helix domain-containing protein [Planctomycetota bacterium]